MTTLEILARRVPSRKVVSIGRMFLLETAATTSRPTATRESTSQKAATLAPSRQPAARGKASAAGNSQLRGRGLWARTQSGRATLAARAEAEKAVDVVETAVARAKVGTV